MSKSKNRPYWLNTPCPAWCGTKHRKHDLLGDRNHTSEWTKRLKLSLHEPDRVVTEHQVFKSAPEREVYLEQDVREVAPRVVVDGAGRLKLTIAEAFKLARALTMAVNIAEGGAR
jgi:hypothetical protein